MIKPKTKEQIIADNFKEILDKTSNSHVNSVLEILIDNPNTIDIVNENIEYVLDRIKDNNYDTKIFIATLSQSEKGKEFLENNKYDVLDKVLGKHIFDIVQFFKKIGIGEDNILNNYLEANKKEIVKEMLRKRIQTSEENKEELIEVYTGTLLRMVEELLDSEDKTFADITELGSGGYSDVYEIGEKVIKIGKPRETYTIPNHRRILQPLIRTNFIDNNNKPVACIEITDKVNKLYKRDISEEELYQIFRELKDAGITSCDFDRKNLGILKRKNVPTLGEKEFDVAPNSVGFDKKGEEEPLDKGDIVIIDSDFIYSDGKTMYDGNFDMAKKFEKRYQQEKAAEIAKSFNKKETNQETNIEHKGEEK